MILELDTQILDSFVQLPKPDQRAVIKRLSKREKYLVKRMLKRAALAQVSEKEKQSEPKLNHLFSSKLVSKISQVIQELKRDEINCVTPNVAQVVDEYLLMQASKQLKRG